MDRVTLIDKGIEFMARFAAPSILTGFFVAAIPGVSREEIEDAFTDPGDILVHREEELYADKTYKGYTGINEIRENEAEIIVLLDKEKRE